MPITKSAKKAVRQNIRRKAKNLAWKKTLRETIKNFKRSPNAQLLSEAYKRLDKTAKIKLIKKNKASRLKSKLAKLLIKK